MNIAFRFFLFSGLLAASVKAASPTKGAFETGDYRNLFGELLGKTDAEIDAKLKAAWQQLTRGDEKTERLLYSVPGDKAHLRPDFAEQAYVPDVANEDVRTEGLSYGMMIAVQLNHQKEFDALWKFARTNMYYTQGPLRGFFAWHTSYSGEKLSPGPASDGEEWFLMSLFFASHRWGDGEGMFNYGREAQVLVSEMLHKREEEFHGPVTNLFDPITKQVVFVPQGNYAKFSDPSYQLPAFYELWSRWAADENDRIFLAAAVKASREALQKAAHPKTGLMPDYANFDGTPYVSEGHEDFRYDAWRTLSNPALDYSWWAADSWQVKQANRVLTFLASQRANHAALFRLDGTPIRQPGDATTPGYDSGLLAMAATAGLAADPAIAKPFVQELWDAKMPTGRYRYYNGLLTMLGLLEASGQFRIYAPRTP